VGTFYRDALARQGHDAVAHEVASEWASGDREAATAAVPDGLLDELGAAGTPGECRERLRAWDAVDGVDAVAVSFPRGADPDEIRATVAALATE
jgi:alkanesulfonate monooxygenase SsuD/methylene tetrahydromethanopterin reductase-like flavin-dependent oxidoreductase (luciferase family)